ncbi:peptidase S54 [Sorangium cellulosum]|jgi:membrane associated rhomboid family serine protease|uniref:Peptidase S54 n=1 Tax=Sorangium cellulosum TaxID=56 RepID=A0A4V0NCT0_SORCE|nr:rhomboid family intramembrane serine protease [Sorangium cellulosum]AUX20242.1 peptidase S54 [Sorangium cellulosum]
MLPLRDQLPTRRVPLVNYLLIALNLLGFFWMRSVISAGIPPDRLLFAWGLVPGTLLAEPEDTWWTVFSSMFLHDPTGWAHLGGNMLFLWIFGDNVEDALGSLRYAAFYVLSGIAAAGAQILIDPGSTIPMVGASGAISGVLAAYGSLYPRSPITVLNPIPLLWLIFGLFLEFPAWLVILEYFVVNLLNGLGSIGMRSGGVAFFAHLGGFVAGLILIRFFMVGRAPREYERWHKWRSPPRRAARPDRRVDPWDPERRRDPWGY